MSGGSFPPDIRAIMMKQSMFFRRGVCHATARRIRFRYACHEPRAAGLIMPAITRLPGVTGVRINTAIRSLVIDFDPAITGEAALVMAIRGLSPPAHQGSAGTPEASLSNVALSGTALLAVRGLQPGLQAPAALMAAVPVFAGAMDDFIRQGITSHVLEALAVAISIGRRDFLAANTTAFLLALGEYLEHSIEQRSDGLLKSLLRPAVDEVWVERDGQEVQIGNLEVRAGDTVIAATGRVIAVDGTVLGGTALVNESTMTGESVPVTRQRGDRVLAGTLVEEGRLRIYAEQVGDQAAAARIADFVGQSLESRSGTQLQASRLADRLVPMVLGLAGLTWLFSRDGARVSAVLQADYSCALKLATPVAFKSAMYRAGKAMILVKTASALERLAEVDTFVFDKTGTLTQGVLQVTDSVALADDYTAEDLLNLAASVEEHYVHPLALAVVRAAHRQPHYQHFSHKEVEFVVAHGVASTIDQQRVVVGSRHFVEEDEGIAVAPHEATIARLLHEGKTLLYIGYGQRLIGILALKDQLRPDAAETLQALRRQGVRRLVMLTGDHPERARAMAEQLGLDEVHAGLLPEDKAGILRQLSETGCQMAFVGDGVNDAPALTGARVGIAMHNGADIARLASDIALLKDDLALVARAHELALATRRLIQRNFQYTVGVNSAILLGAALGRLSPVAASMLHNGSTIGILLRALLGAGLPRTPSAGSGQ